MATPTAPAYDEVYEFLVDTPTPEAILSFRPSEQTQTKIRTLLEANKQGTLNPDQQAELDEFERVEHFVRMLKIKAREKLAGT